ncbi:MAG TPA: hypothetical protein VK557_11000, partial [Pyrinomonadaceae bacterium]|nr:hypothetical protein [Pyrinomonadaceae bacterium]
AIVGKRGIQTNAIAVKSVKVSLIVFMIQPFYNPSTVGSRSHDRAMAIRKGEPLIKEPAC